MTIEFQHRSFRDLIKGNGKKEILKPDDKRTLRHGSLIRSEMHINVLSEDQIEVLAETPGERSGEINTYQTTLTKDEINTASGLPRFPHRVSWRPSQA